MTCNDSVFSPVVSGVEGVAVAVVGRLPDGLHPADDAFITVTVVVLGRPLI